ncbi:uncharacterized protein [Euphorbia lathyris]|uniref:uncharacterized protein isoform X2 n=1 Tax=Euphorbia lathyris TaxID=212925 RepID=UPI003313FE4D
MVQQMVESKFSEYGLNSTETNLSTSDKQFPVAVKKTALRDVQNENRIPNKIENPPKDRVSTDTVKAAGMKRPLPKDPTSPPCHHSPNSSAANAQLVYVRRKFETETSKSSICDVPSNNAVFLNSGQHERVEETSQSKTQIKEPKVTCFSAFAPMPIASFTTTSGKPSVPFPVNSNTRFAPTEPNNNHVASTPSTNNLKAMKNLHWEERYHQLHILLKKIDETDQEDYLQMLRSLSAVELSRHAVELEKRSIQLSLEEAKEMQQVGALNILGKMKNSKTPTSCQGEPDKQ